MEEKPKSRTAVGTLFYSVLILGLAGVVFTMLRRNYLYDSAALYIGLPMLLALGLSLTPKTKSSLGATMKGITIAMLLSAIVFQEGTICILFAAPIFYAVGALIAWPIDRARKRRERDATIRAMSVFAIFAILALEGTTELTSFDRRNEISVTKVISASQADIRAQLEKPADFGQNKPLFLSIFPYPIAVTPLGLNVGDEAKISFKVYKHVWWTMREGALTLKVIESAPNRIVYAAISDDSYLSHYLKWQHSEVKLEPVDASHTRVTWTLSYQRTLDPTWYFGTLQRYAVRLAAGELIDHVATPHG
jgi:hypothetical protein